MTGVLLGQVGTPDQPTPRAVRRYLRRFLSDRRVVDYSPLWWRPLLEGVILPLRSRRSARLYQRIWAAEGSPLLVQSERQRARLQERLGAAHIVVLGMAYGGPPIATAIDTLIAHQVTQIVLLPMFPQYSSATTASITDAVVESLRRGPTGLRRHAPALQVVPPFYRDAGYIDAVRRQIEATLKSMAAAPDHIVVTFHGLPQRFVAEGDPYRGQCEDTARLLVQAMNWRTDEVTVCYQSRFGRERWLEPDTAGIVRGLAGRGVKRPLVVAPGFTTDCLETLDELGNEGRHAFVEGGGRADAYSLAPCLNDSPRWIDAMAHLIANRSVIPPTDLSAKPR